MHALKMSLKYNWGQKMQNECYLYNYDTRILVITMLKNILNNSLVIFILR